MKNEKEKWKRGNLIENLKKGHEKWKRGNSIENLKKGHEKVVIQLKN